MKLRRKSVQRIGILVLAVSGLVVVCGFLYWQYTKQLRDQLFADLKTGQTAYLSHDYARALEPLDRYLREYPDDTKAAMMFADARFRVETGNNSHIKIAVDKLEQILKREPNHIDAKNLLLEIYPQTTNTDALEKLATEVLEKEPENWRALNGMLTARLRQSRTEEGLKIVTKLAEVRPEDLRWKTLVMQLMHQLQKPNAAIVEYAGKQYAADKEDPRYLLLQAFAANYANEGDKAIWYLQQAAAKPINDPETVRLLASIFDQMKRFDESRVLLEQTADRTKDPEVIRVLMTRLWQSGRDLDIINRLSALDLASPKSDPVLLALRAMALFQAQRTSEARQIVANLKDRKDSRKAAAWVLALEARFEDTARPQSELARKLVEALSRDPDNGIFRSWLADVYWNLGEAALALRQWQAAAIAMPSWSKPYLGMSHALLQLGRTADAVEAARAAHERAPAASAATLINYAEMRYRLFEETSDPASAAEVLHVASQILKARPNEPRTLPILVALLARTGERDKATALLDGVLADRSKFTPEALIALAGASRNEGLEREIPLLTGLDDSQVTPRLALTRATLLAEEGKTDDALADLRARAGRAKPQDRVPWLLAIAHYLDITDHPTASDNWHKLAAEHTDSLDVQRAVLASRSVRSDRAFVAQTIDRLKAITGEDGQQWKLERARWLIESPDVMRDGVEAAFILREIILNSPNQSEPRLLLARAHELTGNVVSAIDHLKHAQSIDPRSAQVTIELVRLLQKQGQTDQIRDVLKQMSATANMTSRQRVLLASLFADVGDTQRAIDLLTVIQQRGALPQQGRLLLAELYRRNGSTALAEALYADLLANSPSHGALAKAAEFYAMQGELELARKTLARLSEVSAEAAIARARFEERFGTPDAALGLYRAASETKTEAGWVALIEYLLRTQDFSQAASVARTAQQQFPGSIVIANRQAESQALANRQQNPKDLQPLIDALARDPSRQAEVDSLKALQEIQNSKLTPAEITTRLRAVADKHPRFLPVQEQVIENYLSQRKFEEAVTIARRTMEALPTDPASARLAVRTLRSAGRWRELQLAAEQWKTRSASARLDADVAVAEALVELKQPEDAIARLEPHRANIERDVRAQTQAAVVLARAMLASNRGKSARDMLQPMLKDTTGRRQWRQLAVGAAPTHTEAAAWLEAVAAATPKGQVDEQFEEARAWEALGRKFEDKASLERAIATLNAYLAVRAQDGQALMLLGTIHHQLGHLQAAESALRAILGSKPDHPAAANDLACLLTAQNRSLDEAEKLARLAVSKSPDSAGFHDTLARVLLAKNQLEPAKASFETALRLDPALLDARVGLARLLRQTGNTPGALRELDRVNTQLNAHPGTGKHLKAEIETLRAQLSRND